MMTSFPSRAGTAGKNCAKYRAKESPRCIFFVSGRATFAPGPASAAEGLDFRERDALLALVLAAAIAVGGLADLVGLEEDDLRDALVRVDLRRQRRRVGELQRHVAFPLRLERR